MLVFNTDKSLSYKISIVSSKLGSKYNIYEISFSSFVLHNHEDRYVLGSSGKELERVDNIQSLVFHDKTLETLRLAGIRPVMSCTEDIDHGFWLSYPNDIHLEQLRKCLVSLLKHSSSDPYIARKIYKIFLKQNLKPNVDSYSVCVPMSTCPHNMMGVSMAETLKDKILGNKLMSYGEFDIMLNGLKEYSNKKDGFVSVMGFRVWSNC